MIVLIRKKHIGFSVLFLLFAVGAIVLLHTGSFGPATAVSGSGPTAGRPIVVVDPGHGGEDGGAVAGDGTVESNLNLQIALRINDLLLFLGEPTAMTRSEDISIYNPGTQTLRQKKVSDLKNRVALVNGLEQAVLLSIHQNCLPSSPKTHGAQVFYNSDPGAKPYANAIQAALNAQINVGNEKKEKQISSAIYLTKNVTAPAILVECGFLSNSAETEQLKQPDYQLRLAAAIAAGYRNSGTTGES